MRVTVASELKRVKKVGLKVLTHGTVKGILEFILTVGILYFFIVGALVLVFRTDSFWMAVISDSMSHESVGESWRDYFENEQVRRNFLASYGISVDNSVRSYETTEFPIQGGFERGDLLFIQGVGSVSEISVGDVLIIDRSPYTIPLTHRVLQVWTVGDEVRFTTKGDHNVGLVDDRSTPWYDDIVVVPEKIVGKVVFVVPKLGNVGLWFQGR